MKPHQYRKIESCPNWFSLYNLSDLCVSAAPRTTSITWIKLVSHSNKPNRVVLLVLAVGAAYFVIGYVFGELDDLGVTERGVFLWRLGAWIASGVVFAVHLCLESKRFRNPTLRVALHASLGVAFGAFLLAVNAAFHAAWITSTAPFRRYLVALVAWPMFTAVPAFLCALVVAMILNRFPKATER